MNASGTEVQYSAQGKRRILRTGIASAKGNETERNVQARETKRDCLNAKEGMEIEAAVGKGLGSRGHNAADWCRGHGFSASVGLAVGQLQSPVRTQSRQQSEAVRVCLNGGQELGLLAACWLDGYFGSSFMRMPCLSPAVQDLSGCG